MRNIKLDSILLFAFVIPFIMTYRISPGATPYWLFGLIFLGLFLYILFDILNLKDRTYSLLKTNFLWGMIIVVIGSALFSSIIVRHQTSPIYNVHDIILQQEASIKFFLHGTNPYLTTYFNTSLAQWHYSDTEVNPALYHFVMEPFYILFTVPFYLVMGHTIGFFDARVPLFFLFLMTLIFASKLDKNQDKKRELMTILAFNPATLGYFLEGRDDIFMFAFLFAAFYFIYKKNIFLSSILMALAFAIKQSVWPIFPFYFAYLYFKNRSLAKTIKDIIPFAVTFIIIVAPFALWNMNAFFDSTILYLSGNAVHSYPIAGYGFGMVLNSLGFIKDIHSYFPFWIFQAVIGIPLMTVLIFWQKRKNTIFRLVLSYGLFLFVFWYLSRYFNNSHLGYLSTVFITAYFWPKDNN